MEQTSIVILAVIALITFFGAVAHAQSKYTLGKWLEELRTIQNAADGGSISSSWMAEMIKEYEHYGLNGTEPNTQALVERHLYNQPIRLLGLFQTPVGNIVRMLSQLPSLSIIIGVLGTFIGLTNAMFAMQSTLTSLGGEAASVSNIVESISAPFQGMSIAFVTSIAGIGGALILTVLQTGFFSKGTSLSYLLAKTTAECESLLDHQVRSRLEKQKPRDSLEKLLDRLVGKVQESFEKSIGDFGSQMTRFTAGLQHAMEDVQQILSSQREYTETFAESTASLQQFSKQFHESAEKLGSVHSGFEQSVKQLGDKVTHLEKQFVSISQKQDGNNRRFEQIIQRSDGLIEQSQRKTEELAESFLRAMDQQINQYQDQFGTIERNMQQKNDEWYYRYQEKQEHYHRAADAFSASVQQLEKAMFNMAEKIKRDIQDNNHSQRDREARNQQDGMREVTRAVDSFYQGISHDFKDIHRYLDQFYQLLHRIYETSNGHRNTPMYREERPERRQVPSRVIE